MTRSSKWRELRAAGVDVAFHIYPGLSHWVVEDDRSEYTQQAARLAWERTFAFLKANL
ncbi:MAG TPA: dienelactone hydrolase family protein [Anaerolineales bacterium]